MRELLPLVLGLLLGGLMPALPRRLRVIAFPVGCVAVGALASALNGELSERGWAVFVSIDTLLVWVGAALAPTTLWLWRTLRTA
jgi:hypothetical protein